MGYGTDFHNFGNNQWVSDILYGKNDNLILVQVSKDSLDQIDRPASLRLRNSLVLKVIKIDINDIIKNNGVDEVRQMVKTNQFAVLNLMQNTNEQSISNAASTSAKPALGISQNLADKLADRKVKLQFVDDSQQEEFEVGDVSALSKDTEQALLNGIQTLAFRQIQIKSPKVNSSGQRRSVAANNQTAEQASQRSQKHEKQVEPDSKHSKDEKKSSRKAHKQKNAINEAAAEKTSYDKKQNEKLVVTQKELHDEKIKRKIQEDNLQADNLAADNTKRSRKK